MTKVIQTYWIGHLRLHWLSYARFGPLSELQGRRIMSKEPRAKRGSAVFAAALLFASSAIAADFKEVVCTRGVSHFVRNGGAEIHVTALTIRNANPTETVTWTRLTIYDGFGQVVHDSGPDTANPHPMGSLGDITFVPPRSGRVINTVNIWGSASVAGGPNARGIGMQADIRLETEGDAELAFVGGSRRARERFTSGGQGQERARMGIKCHILASGKLKK
jgi:hypothetical protein